MDRASEKLLAKLAEVRGERIATREQAAAARRAARQLCSDELRQIRAAGVVDLRATRGRNLLREEAGQRRCRVRRSAIGRTVRERQRDLSAAERRAAAELRRVEIEEGKRSPATRAQRSKPVLDKRGRPLSRDQIDQIIGEAQSTLGDVEGRDYGDDVGSAAAARWWFTKARLRDMLGRLRPGRHLYESAVESYDDNHGEINAAFRDVQDREGPRAHRREDRTQQRAIDRETARTQHLLAGAPIESLGAPERIAAALRAREHEPHLARRVEIECERCGGRGRLERTSGGRVSFHADAKLRAPRCRAAGEDELEPYEREDVPF